MRDWYEGTVGTTVRLYPGGVEVEIIVSEEAGFTVYTGWVASEALKMGSLEETRVKDANR